MIKVNILWQIGKVGGGGNQFLKTLKRYFVNKRVYVEDPRLADVLLVNSKDYLKEASEFNTRKRIHRIDGIFKMYRGEEHYNLDLQVYDFARKYADGVIFQSEWSREQSKKNGMSDSNIETVIFNCADDKYFNIQNKFNNQNGKTRLITSSWSSNWKKGFKIYEFLDRNLDFNKYEYVFVGRSPIQFKNIQMKGVMSSKQLAEELKKSDIFVTATENDACSNSVVEALSCGLAVIGKNSGGTPEIIKGRGDLFSDFSDVIQNIDGLSEKVKKKKHNIKAPSVDSVGKKYYDFIKKVYAT